MAQDALGVELKVGDWLACIRATRCSFSIYPAKLHEIKTDKSFSVYCGRANRYNYEKKAVVEDDDIRNLHAFHNVIKVFPENLPEDVYFEWAKKLEPVTTEEHQ